MEVKLKSKEENEGRVRDDIRRLFRDMMLALEMFRSDKGGREEGRQLISKF